MSDTWKELVVSYEVISFSTAPRTYNTSITHNINANVSGTTNKVLDADRTEDNAIDGTKITHKTDSILDGDDNVDHVIDHLINEQIDDDHRKTSDIHETSTEQSTGTHAVTATQDKTYSVSSANAVTLAGGTIAIPVHLITNSMVKYSIIEKNIKEDVASKGITMTDDMYIVILFMQYL